MMKLKPKFYNLSRKNNLFKRKKTLLKPLKCFVIEIFEKHGTVLLGSTLVFASLIKNVCMFILEINNF